MFESAARPLDLRMRPDLEVLVPAPSEAAVYVVKDPVALAYYRFDFGEFQVLKMLDGRHSLRQIQQQLHVMLAPARVTCEHIMQIVADLFTKGLVLSGSHQVGELLRERRAKDRRREIWQRLANPLAIRVRGLDCTGAIDFAARCAGVLFGPVFVLAWIAFVLSAVTIVANRGAQLYAELPGLSVLSAGPAMLWLAVAISLVKILHELGHAVACRYFGAECHEVGLMLLLFVPTLYCDVSDAWMIPQRWKRIVVSAAGMLVELTLAAAAVWTWRYSEPGVVHALSLNLILVCTVSTLIINANPLLRYDGYFILSDWCGVPNLWQTSRNFWREKLGQLCLGLRPEPDGGDGEGPSRLVAVYGVLSPIYRVVFVTAILIGFYQFLSPHGLEPLAWGLVAMTVGGSGAPIATSLKRTAADPLVRRQINPFRAALTLLVITGIVAAVFLIPFPASIRGPAVLEVQDAQYLYSGGAGELADCLPEGAPVESGQTVATIVNRELDRSYEKLASEKRQQEQKIAGLRSLSVQSRKAADQIPVEEKVLARIGEQLEVVSAQRDKLILRARRRGFLLAPPVNEVRETPDSDVRLARRNESPLLPENRGCWIEAKSLIGLIGDPADLEALAVLTQQQVDRINVGDKAALLLDGAPGAPIQGTVVEVGQTDVDAIPRLMEGDPRIEYDRGPASERKSLHVLYFARVELKTSPAEFCPGLRGEIKIATAPKTLAAQLGDWIERTFRAD